MIPDKNNTTAAADSNTCPYTLADSFLDLDSLKDWFLDVDPDFADIMSNTLDSKTSDKSLVDAKDGVFPSGSEISCQKTCLGAKGVVFPMGSEISREKMFLGAEDGVLPSGSEISCEKSGIEGKVDFFPSRPELVCEGAEVVSTVVEGGGSMVDGFGCVIEEELKKVSLVGSQVESAVGVEQSEVKAEVVTVKEVGVVDSEGSSDSESESESESSSSSSSSSSSDTEEEEEEEEQEEGEVGAKVVKMDEDVEEGEIRENDKQTGGGSESEDEDVESSDQEVEKMVSWSDIDDEEDGAGGMVAEPIRSKNEAKVLPPVPPVNVTLEPHHKLSPIGVVLSVLGAQVIVEGVEKHNPLNEASILWITESRSPLGLIDEIFGPVKNPYYVVRYNSESEVPAGIAQGTSISYVQEFADHVLNDKNLYRKGYDASGENDEELSEEVEFSDDEKEAEYRRMQKMSKRGMNDQKPANKKNKNKVRNKDMSWKKGRPPTNQAPPNMGQSQQRQNQQYPSGAHLVNHGNNPSSPAMGNTLAGGNVMVPTFPQATQTVGFLPHSSGVYPNAAMPSQQPQNPAFPNVFPANGNQWLTQTNMQHPSQMPLLSGFPTAFNQQFNPNQGPLPTFSLPGGPASCIPAPIGGQMSPWPGFMNPIGYNQTTFGMGMQPQQNLLPINAQQPQMQPQQNRPPINAQQPGMQPPVVFPNNTGGSQIFNMGSSFEHGRPPHRRGAGHFRGRGGPRSSR